MGSYLLVPSPSLLRLRLRPPYYHSDGLLSSSSTSTFTTSILFCRRHSLVGSCCTTGPSHLPHSLVFVSVFHLCRIQVSSVHYPFVLEVAGPALGVWNGFTLLNICSDFTKAYMKGEYEYKFESPGDSVVVDVKNLVNFEFLTSTNRLLLWAFPGVRRRYIGLEIQDNRCVFSLVRWDRRTFPPALLCLVL